MRVEYLYAKGLYLFGSPTCIGAIVKRAIDNTGKMEVFQAIYPSGTTVGPTFATISVKVPLKPSNPGVIS
jgi:hypothetical protein